jgi:prefoldin subunit 5
LSIKLELISNSKGRLLKISQQQEEIIQLNASIKNLEASVDDLREANRKLTQSLHIRGDRLAACENQLNNLQKSYEQGVLNLEPLVLEQVTQTQIDQRDIQALRYDVSMGVSRAIYTDRRLQDCEAELVVQRAEVDRLAKLVVRKLLLYVTCLFYLWFSQLHEKRTVKQQKQEIDRLNKVNLVIVSAKVNCESLAKEHVGMFIRFLLMVYRHYFYQISAKSGIHIKKSKELQTAVDSLKAEMGDMEAYIVELQGMVRLAEVLISAASRFCVGDTCRGSCEVIGRPVKYASRKH